MTGLLRRYKSPIYGNYRKGYLLGGLVTGVIMALFVLLMWLASNAISTPETYATDIVMAVCIFVISYLYRERLPERKVFFKELMLLGLGIGFVSAVVYGLGLMVYGQIDTEFVSRCIDARIASMKSADGIEEAELAQAVQLVKDYSLGDWSFIGGFRSGVMSIIIAFASALIFRTEQNIRK